MERQDNSALVHRMEIVGDMDRHAMEALYLEVRRLAKRYGVEVKGFRIESVADGGGDSEGEETTE
jgi:hypothetical protein